MYKVFFNDSCIVLKAEFKKSLKNNISDGARFDDYFTVNQIIEKVEMSGVSGEYVLTDPNPEQLWQHFKSRFVEIPAAGGIVRNSRNQWLFIFRLGFWDLPKGKIEKNESPEAAAIREVEEECGLSGLSIVKPLPATYHIYRSPFLSPENNLVLKETSWFLMSYSGTEQLKPQAEEDITDVRWFETAELDMVISQTYPSLRDLISKII